MGLHVGRDTLVQILKPNKNLSWIALLSLASTACLQGQSAGAMPLAMVVERDPLHEPQCRQASRLPPSATPTERNRSRWRARWAGGTPALRWARSGSRASRTVLLFSFDSFAERQRCFSPRR